MVDAVRPLAPSQLRLLHRNVEVTIANQPAPTPAASTGTFFAREPNALVVTDLRVRFEVKRSLGKSPNPAQIIISNMQPDSRARLQRKPVYVILRAGHDGVLRPLFEGNVTNAISSLQVTDWETKIQVADGGRAYAHSQFARSYAPPVQAIRVLTDAAAAMGLTLPPDIEQAPELRQALADGVSVYGPTRDVLTKILAPYGFGWSVQNGRLQILRQGATNQRRAWVIDAEAGLIGTPESSFPNKAGKTAETTIKLLLFPEVIPGDQIRLTSKSFSGVVFRVNDVTHAGDTQGTEWTTTLKVAPPGSPLPKGKGSS